MFGMQNAPRSTLITCCHIAMYMMPKATGDRNVANRKVATAHRKVAFDLCTQFFPKGVCTHFVSEARGAIIITPLYYSRLAHVLNDERFCISTDVQ